MPADWRPYPRPTGWFAGQPFTLDGTVGVPSGLDGHVSVPVDLKFRAPQAGGSCRRNLAVKGRLALNALGFEGLDAAATLHTQYLAALRPVLAQGLPALTAVEFEGRLAIPATAALVRFKDAKLKSDQGDVAGEGTVELGGTRLLDARLRSNALDLGAMLEASGCMRPCRCAP